MLARHACSVPPAQITPVEATAMSSQAISRVIQSPAKVTPMAAPA